MHTVTNQMAQELTVLDVAPPPEEIQRRWPQSRRAGGVVRWSCWASMERMCQRVPTAPGSAGQAHEGSGPGVRCGVVSGATPRGFASLSSMASASSIC